ncbi:MAG: hypothetical protein LBC70_10290 [Chitinispirillales bacterium]|nr:hypothetical protein [Chitinispirillales bacterium]
MSIELLSELEDKVGSLVQSLKELRDENVALRETVGVVEGLQSENGGLKGENEELRRQLEALRADADEQREKMDSAAERIKGLLSTLNSAQ